MVKHVRIKNYKSKLRDNNVKYSMTAGPYKTTHDMNVAISLPVLRKGSLYQHIYQIKVIFDRLNAKGLKVNDHKFSFGPNKVVYIGYIITQE